MESLGGSWHNGWESKKFPLMQKGNLRNKFKLFPFVNSEMWSMVAGKTSTHKKQTGHDRVGLNRKNKNRFDLSATRFGYEVRYPRAGHDFVFEKGVARSRFNAWFGYRMLSKSRANLLVYALCAAHARQV